MWGHLIAEFLNKVLGGFSVDFELVFSYVYDASRMIIWFYAVSTVKVIAMAYINRRFK